MLLTKNLLILIHLKRFLGNLTSPRNVFTCLTLTLTLTLNLSRCWENENDLTVINLNNILNIPHELLEELMEALEENVYVRELSLVNTGLTDKVAYALAKVDFNQWF